MPVLDECPHSGHMKVTSKIKSVICVSHFFVLRREWRFALQWPKAIVSLCPWDRQNDRTTLFQVEEWIDSQTRPVTTSGIVENPRSSEPMRISFSLTQKKSVSQPANQIRFPLLVSMFGLGPWLVRMIASVTAETSSWCRYSFNLYTKTFTNIADTT